MNDIAGNVADAALKELESFPIQEVQNGNC